MNTLFLIAANNPQAMKIIITLTVIVAVYAIIFALLRAARNN